MCDKSYPHGLILDNNQIGCSNEMNPDNRMKIDKINVHLTNKLKATLMTNKGKEHAAENEYRIAIIPDKEWLNKIKYRNRFGIITPYIKIKFDSIPISELVIGPKIFEGISEKGCDAMLKSYGYTHAKVVKTKLDVRF